MRGAKHDPKTLHLISFCFWNHFFEIIIKVGGGAITVEGSSRVDLYNSTVFVNNIISTNTTLGNAISLERMNSTEPLYLSCDDSIIFCNGVDSISGISDDNTNCLSNGIRDPLPVSCQV